MDQFIGGGSVRLEGDRLRLTAPVEPPSDVVAALKAAKLEIVILLTPDASGASGADYWRVFNERFAYQTADGIEPELARLEAFDRVVSEWLKRSFDLIDATTDPSRCVHCGEADDDALLPTAPNSRGWRAWVHDQCHQPWRNARQQQALAALAAYGIEPPSAWLLAKAESELYEREALMSWCEKPMTYADEFDAHWAKRTLEALKIHGFRAFVDAKAALFLKDETGEKRPPPAHAVKGLGRIALGLRADPTLIDTIWPKSGRSRPHEEKDGAS